MKDALIIFLLLAIILFPSCSCTVPEDDERRAEIYAHEKIEILSELQRFEDLLAHGSSYIDALTAFSNVNQYCLIDHHNRILVTIDMYMFNYATLDSIAKYGGKRMSDIRFGIKNPTSVEFYIPPESLRSLAMIYNIIKIRFYKPPPPPPVTY
jgi:hypothetical protein